MTLKRVQKNRFEQMVYISVFLMIYVSNETVLFGTNANKTFSLISYIITFFLSVYWMGRAFFGRKQSRNLLPCLALLAFNLCTMISNMDLSIKYGYICLIILFAYSFCEKVPTALFIGAYRKIMLIFAAASLVSFLLYEFLYPVLTIFPIIENESGFGFYNLILAVVMQRKDYYVYRNFGIFREPGVFAVYLLFALIFELFNKSRPPRFLRVAVYCLTILLTYSTAGYIVMFIVLMVFSLSRKSKKQRTYNMVIFGGILLLLIIILCNESLTETVFSKLFSKNTSLDSRVGAIWTNLNLSFRDLFHFLVGNGFTYIESNFSTVASDLGFIGAHNTNTLLKMFSVYGIGYFIVLVIAVLRFCLKFESNLLVLTGITISIFLMLSNEDFIVNALMYMIVFYAFRRSGQRTVLDEKNLMESI